MKSIGLQALVLRLIFSLIFIFEIISFSVASESLSEKPWLWTIEFKTKQGSLISRSEVSDLADRALSGDKRLRRQFAVTYFGCERFVYQERCHLLRAHADLVEKFLNEIINSEPLPENEEDRKDIAFFQSAFAYLMFSKASPGYIEGDEYCQSAVKYSLLAMRNGDVCFSRYFLRQSLAGRCMQKSDEKYNDYYELTKLCNRPD